MSSAKLSARSALAMNTRTVHVLSPLAKNVRIHAGRLVVQARSIVEVIELGYKCLE
jgi:hypothetical protein